MKTATNEAKGLARATTSPADRSRKVQENGGAYISPRELAIRWCCSRSSVDRIAARASLTRLCLGDGANGIIRYVLKEVENYERSRMLGR